MIRKRKLHLLVIAFIASAITLVGGKTAHGAAPTFWARMTAPNVSRPGRIVVYRLTIRNSTDVRQSLTAIVSSHNIVWDRPLRHGGNLLSTNFPLGARIHGILTVDFAPSHIMIRANQQRRFYFAFASLDPKTICLNLDFSTAGTGGWIKSRCTVIKN